MRWIKKCMQSIQNSTIPLVPVVIDNNSMDGTQYFIKSNYPETILIENKINLGFGKANNIGLKLALDQQAEFIFLLNQDAYLARDTIENVVEFQKKNIEFGILSPVQLNGDGSKIDKNFSRYISCDSIFEINNMQKVGKDFLTVPFVNAAAWLITRSFLTHVGGFDPLFSHYGEDRDLCCRASYHGYKIGIVLTANIFHDRENQSILSLKKTAQSLKMVGLAHLKNINKSLFANCFSWIIQRLKKGLKWIVLLRFNMLFIEIVVGIELSLLILRIYKSRRKCRKTRSAFILPEIHI